MIDADFIGRADEILTSGGVSVLAGMIDDVQTTM